ncbi:hypothetical protein P8452_21157 [Trifolium repens]|nr:hypothetical protein P8452_21157 [Trifolium repens]
MWIVLLLRSTITVRGDFAIDIGSQEGTMVGHDLALSCLGWLIYKNCRAVIWHPNHCSFLSKGYKGTDRRVQHSEG